MLVRATRTLSALTARALFYGGLFVVVVLLHLALTGALRSQGWSPSLSLLGSGAVVLALVLVLVNVADWLRERRAARLEVLRMKQGLPGGPCCVVWRRPEPETALDEDDDAMPWQIAGPLRARYPKLARRLGVEGLAIVEFEVSAQGAAKNINCVDAWPSDVFYEAAREALVLARFEPKPDVHPRFGASYKMPFVFRIAGAARLREPGMRARTLRPTLHAARRAVEKMRGVG
jgi:TonB family protein